MSMLAVEPDFAFASELNGRPSLIGPSLTSDQPAAMTCDLSFAHVAPGSPVEKSTSYVAEWSNRRSFHVSS
jgi:hypothetical protein